MYIESEMSEMGGWRPFNSRMQKQQRSLEIQLAVNRQLAMCPNLGMFICSVRMFKNDFFLFLLFHLEICTFAKLYPAILVEQCAVLR